MFSNIEIEQYFKKINFQGIVCYSQETLNNLQGLHYMHIPYENFDILSGLELSLNTESMYKRLYAITGEDIVLN